MTVKKLMLVSVCAALLFGSNAKAEALVLEEEPSYYVESEVEGVWEGGEQAVLIEEGAAQEAEPYVEDAAQTQEPPVQVLPEQSVRIVTDTGGVERILFSSGTDTAAMVLEEADEVPAVTYDIFQEDRDAIEAAGRVLRAEVKGHREQVELRIFCRNEYDTQALLNEVEKTAFSVTGDPTEGDYLRYSVADHGLVGASQYVSEAGCLYMLSTWWDYYLPLEQEDELTAAVEETVWNLYLNGMSMEQKINVIYRYVYGASFYDYEEERISHTAYASMFLGKSVCQGDALLFSRVLWEAGIPNRVVTGGSHMWNIVQVDGYYYNCDVTYEKTKGNGTAYFLKTDGEFAADHLKDSEFLEAEFRLWYPMAG